MGEICLELFREFQARPDSCQLLQNLCQSRMGIYLHKWRKGNRVQLRDLSTEQTSLADVPSGYLGVSGEIGYTRVLSALEPGAASVILTTPWVRDICKSR